MAGMTSLIGQILLILSGISAGLSIYLGFTRRARLNIVLTELQFYFTCAAFACLIYAYVTSDFSLFNVYSNSNSSKPLIYKIAGSWGNHEGSMLLMIFSISAFSFVFSLFSKFTDEVKSQILSIQSAISLALLIFTIFTSNPFSSISPIPLEGLGLNPLLQDLGLSTHPPILYLGYVGFSLTFSCAIVILLRGGEIENWAKLIKPWIILPWSFLTLGIGLGSWWAYHELGWGGFWFWDPVENASLMPWLISTALLHSISVCINTGGLVIWSLLLSILTFCLSLLGTFLVRSGILTSVHSFAHDPKRGIYILIILSIISILSLLIFACRAHKLTNIKVFTFFSKEGGILCANIFLSASAACILLGTLYPIFFELFTTRQITIGQPYFVSTGLPIFLPLFGLAAIFSPLKWNKNAIPLRKWLLQIIFTFLLLSAFFSQVPLPSPQAIIAMFLCTQLLIAMLWYYLTQLFLQKPLPLTVHSMVIAHIAVALIGLSITMTTNYASEYRVVLSPNLSVTAGKYLLTLREVQYVQQQNFISRQVRVNILENNRIIELIPESRYYPVEKITTQEAAIFSRLFSDLYLAVEDLAADHSVIVRLYYKPMMSCLWGSVLLLTCAALLPLLKRKPL
jgi:cytochrome c-type biogenesis protein CcmF